MSGDAEGPIIIWQNYGSDGWSPSSYGTLKEALLDQRHGHEFIITRKIDVVVEEAPLSQKEPL